MSSRISPGRWTRFQENRIRVVFYTVTHLHPAGYAILALIFVLSVINLVVQGWISTNTWPISFVLRLISNGDHGFAERDIRGLRTGSLKKKPPRRFRGELTSDDQVLTVRPVPAAIKRTDNPRPPLPLDGVNHPLPDFASAIGTQTGAPRILDGRLAKNQGPGGIQVCLSC